MPMTRRQALLLRAAFFDRLRAFFRDRGFLEVDSPLLLRSVPAEHAIRPFELTLHRFGRSDAEAERRYLPTSPELGLKRQLAELGRPIFELGHAFRDAEEEGTRHRAHFRMLEWYRPGGELDAIAEDLEALLHELAMFMETQTLAPIAPPAALRGRPKLDRVSVPDALARYLSHAVRGPQDFEDLLQRAHALGHDNVERWQEAFHVLVALLVEPQLGRARPTMLSDYPAGLASMALAHPDRPWLAQQFELFVDGVELANCYAEVTDPEEQRRRFEEDRETARREGRSLPPTDPELLEALGRLPSPTAGGSLGVERLLMLWTGADSLDDVRP